MNDETAFRASPYTTQAIRLDKSSAWIASIRDVCVIGAALTIIGTVISAYDLHARAIDAQIQAAKTQMQVLEKLNAASNETQNDKALALLKSQKDQFDQERKNADAEKQEVQRQIQAQALEFNTRLLQLQNDLAYTRELASKVSQPVEKSRSHRGQARQLQAP